MSPLSGGGLFVRLRCDGAQIQSVDLQLQRPLQLLNALHGCTLAQVLQRLPRLFPLCGSAHVLCALDAAEQALATPAGTAQQSARALIALADTAAAHVWRTRLDWSDLLGSPPDPQPVAQARRLLQSLTTALYPDGDWCHPGGGRLAPDRAMLSYLRVQFADLYAALAIEQVLAGLRGGLACALLGADLCWVPELHSRFAALAAATTACFARLDAALESACALEGSAAAVAATFEVDGSGQAETATARGPLRYTLELRAGRLHECSVQAPIDRDFTPRGSAWQLLDRLRSAQNPALAARWVLVALDPCTPVHVDISEGVA